MFVRLMCLSVVILLNQSNLGCQRLVIIPLSLVRYFIVVRLHPYEQIILSVNYKRKNVGACICLSHPSRPTTALQKEQTEKQPRWSIQTPVKCALRILDPRSTLRRAYTTLRGVTPAFVLVLHIDCGSFDGSKTKRQ